MSTFNLGLPLDIPWKRICFTQDMTHARICTDDPPPAWRPSIVIYGYQPEEEYQTLKNDGYTISYLKVTVTVTPDTPVVNVKGAIGATVLRGNAIQSLQRTSPCYGALLHLSVGPKSGGSASQIYIADAEPKKRELYEAVTDTGQFASGSLNRLAVGKSGMTSDTTESFSSTSAGVSVSVPIVKDLLTAGVSGQAGDRAGHVQQQTDTTATDRSTERREMQSHTTALSQMYNLFQAFHVGTNRAVFFMEPRPHVLSNQATFINGPRALEGMQDMFLVIVRPNDMADFCVNARLETAHLNTSEVVVNDLDSALFEVDFTAPAPEGTPADRHEYGEVTRFYTPPAGWIVDVEKTRDQALNIIEDEPGWAPMASDVKIESVMPHQVAVYAKVAWHTFIRQEDGNTGQTPGHIRCNLVVHLKPAKALVKETVDQMYVNVRKLCCCPGEAGTGDGGGGEEGGGGGEGGGSGDPGAPTPPVFDPNNPCTFIWDLLKFADPNSGPEWLKKIKWPTSALQPHLKQEVANGVPTTETLRESAGMTKWLRDQLLGLLKMSTAPTWVDCPIPFSKSDPFFSRAADALAGTAAAAELERSIKTTALIPAAERAALAAALGEVSMGAVLRANSAELASATGRQLYQIVQLKEQLVYAIGAAAGTVTTVPAALPHVTGVRIATTVPNPEQPRVLFEMTDPRSMQRVPANEQANVIDITFSDRPNDGQVTTSSITVKKNGVSQTTDVRMVTAVTARVFLTTPMTAGDVYVVTVRGTGGQAITFGSVDLDGEPLGLPSGDGIAGGDFVFAVQIAPPPAAGTVHLAAPLQVTGVAARSTWPSSSSPRIVARMSDPAAILDAPVDEQPNQFLITFSAQPDAGTVSTSTVSVTKDGAAVGATVVLGSDKTATITITDAIVTNALYVVRLNGRTTPAITYLGTALDGEPYRLPSGDGQGGGDFTFVFRAAGAVAQPTPTIPAQRLTVLGVRVLSSVPSSSNPRVVGEMIHPGSVQVVSAADSPDIIEVEFSAAPDSGTVDADSFIVTNGGAALLGTITQPSARVARFKTSAPLAGGQCYTVTLKGDGSNAITLGGAALDGEPLALPSGNGVAGGDFGAVIAVAPAPPAIATQPLMKVRAVKLLSTYPDPANPRLVARMVYANDIPQVHVADKVDRVEIEFTRAPDPGSVSADGFIVGHAGGTVGHTVTMPTTTTARVTLTDLLTADTLYTIAVKGEDPHALTFEGRRLDGEAFAFPSGNGIEGGDFVFKMRVLG